MPRPTGLVINVDEAFGKRSLAETTISEAFPA